MHSLRLLTLLLPELKIIDSLVVRDFYHRFTVDEHSFPGDREFAPAEAVAVGVG